MTVPTPTMTIETRDHTPGAFLSVPTTPPTIPPSSPSDSSDSWEEELWPSTPPEPPLIEGDGIRQVNIGWLRSHPFSVEVYGLEFADKDLVESIKAVGIQTPLQVTVDGVVISGHRRLEAAKQTPLETVPVFVSRPRYAFITVEEQILEANRMRRKDNEQKVREFVAYKVIETARAKARCGYRSDLVPNSARGDAEPKADVSMFAEAALTREVGKARDLAARKVGMVGSTAADGEKVVAALDRLWAAENYRDHGQLRDALFNSIHAALKLGLERGWIPKTAKKTKRTSQVVPTAATEHPGDKPHYEPGDIDQPADDHDPGNTAHELVAVVEVADDLDSEEVSMPTPQTAANLHQKCLLPTENAVPAPPQAAPSSSVDDMSVPPLSALHPSDPPSPTVIPEPVINLDTGSQKPDDRLIPPEAAIQAAAAISKNDFPGCDDPDIVPCSRRCVDLVTAMLNEQAKEFPDMTGHDLCRAVGIATIKIQMAKKWLNHR